MSISVPSEPVYRTCYHLNLSTKEATLGQYNYTETMKKMAGRAAEDKKDGITYWEPDEYGRVWIDPKNPSHATLEPAGPADYSGVQLPAPGASTPPSSSKAEEKRKEKKEEEQKLQEERLRLFREERERMAQQEAMLHRLSMAILSSKR